MARIVDTFAWIEYFKGSVVGRKIKRKIEAEGNLVPTVVIAEISKKFADWGRNDLDEKLSFIRSKSVILPLYEDAAIAAGRIRSAKEVEGMGIVDCVLLATAREYKIKVLTGDQHFKNISEADYFVV